MSLRAVIASAVAVAAIVLACSNDTTGPTLTPVPPPPAHVYVADLNGFVLVFDAPLTNSSVAVDTITSSGPLGIAVDDSGNVAVSELSKWVYLYAKPLASASTPVDSVRSDPYYGYPAFGPDGNLYVATQGAHVLVYTAPVTTGSVADTIKDSLHDAISVAFDRQQRLYVNDPVHGGVRVFDAPYTGAPAFSVDSGMGNIEGIAVDASGRLLAANHSFPKILIYTPTLSGASEPHDSIMTGAHIPGGIAIGGDGYLYVVSQSDSTILVYHPPFSHLSAPAVTVHGGGLVTPYGIAVGK
ncbi:MAG TPA: hypothetical protein VI139_00210 [Gemmatimonadales bacterium]